MFVDTGFSGVEGIVLDAVGTLIDPRPTVAEAYTQAAWRQGVALDVPLLKSRFREQFQTDEIDELRGPLATSEEVEHRRWRRIVSGCTARSSRPGSRLRGTLGSLRRAIVLDRLPRRAPGAREARRSRLSDLRGVHRWPSAAGRGRVAGGSRAGAGRSWSRRKSGYRKPHRRFYEAACHHLELSADRVQLCRRRTASERRLGANARGAACRHGRARIVAAGGRSFVSGIGGSAGAIRN